MAPKDNIQDILNYYSHNDEAQRIARHQLEFTMMRKTLQTYLSEKPLKILELGAGSGTYTKLLVEMGHDVTALEPTEKLLKQNEAQLKDRAQFIHADSRDLLKKIEIKNDADKFDVVLNMGPLYHLEKKEDRELVINSSRQVMKPDGLHWAVFLSRVGYTFYVLHNQPDSLLQDPDGFRDILTQGFYSQHPRNGTFRGHFTDLNELSELHQTCDLKIQKLHALDLCIAGDDQIFNRLTDEQKLIWTEVLFALSSDPSFWGSARTWLTISTL